ncbi:MAG: hypothetical protein ACJ79S_15735, partial [Gemmatimonadaceae bacterium]
MRRRLGAARAARAARLLAAPLLLLGAACGPGGGGDEKRGEGARRAATAVGYGAPASAVQQPLPESAGVALPTGVPADSALHAAAVAPP